jgi:diguanylate cyclase (GGDEF)-like protein
MRRAPAGRDNPSAAAHIDLPGLAAAAPLPSPQGVALEILRLSGEEDVSFARIAAVLRADPALSGRMIKAANVASLSGRRPVASISDAVMVLGLSTVRHLSLGFSLISHYRQGNCQGFDFAEFWSQSVLLGVAAQALSQKVRLAAPEEMFACGMLAEIGRLAFATLYPKEYGELIAKGDQISDDDLRAMEQDRFGIDHAEMSSLMLRDWGFPEIFTTIVVCMPCDRRGVAVADGRARSLLDVLRFACRLRDYCAAEPERRRALLPPLIAGAMLFGVDADALAAMTTEVMRLWHEWAQLLQVVDHASDSVAGEIASGVEDEPAPGSGSGAEPRLRTLVVDDDRAVLQKLKELLESAGHTVRTAGDGDEALVQALEFQPQLLIADLDMPGKNGARLCATLRKTELGKQLYVLALTRSDDEQAIVAAFSAGVDDCVVMPFSPRLLEARLRAAARTLRQQDRLNQDIHTIRSLVTDLAANNRRLQQAAATDPLTGLPNRRYMLDRLDQAWAAARRRGGRLSCIAIDIDHFKGINDTLGHAAGDAALRHVAILLRAKARLQDMVARMGGEEFLVICPDTELEEAARCAERLRVSLAESPFHEGAVVRPITLSAGVACINDRIADAEGLLLAADNALYRAKEAGRNRVALAREGIVVNPKAAAWAGH